jgi:hypothetical protein
MATDPGLNKHSRQNAAPPPDQTQADSPHENGAANGHTHHGFLSGVDATRVCLELYAKAAAASGLDGIFVLTIIDPKTGKVFPQHFAVANVAAMANEAVARGKVANVYFAPAILKKHLPATTRGKTEDIVAVLGVVIDPWHAAVARGDHVLGAARQPATSFRIQQVPCARRRGAAR